MEKNMMHEYQEYVQRRLSLLTPILTQYAMGDFSEKVPIPEEEDEFTALMVSINLMGEDFQEMLNDLEEKQALLDAIANTSPAMIYVYDLVQQCDIFKNSGLETLLGYSVEEVDAMGNDWFVTLIHPDDLPAALEFRKKVEDSSGDESLEFQCRMKHKDGSWRTFHGNERPFQRNSEGRLIQKIGIALDVSKEIEAANALLESEDRLRLAIDASKLGVFDFDLLTGEVNISDEWLAMLDYEPNAFRLNFESWVKMLHPNDVENTLQVYQDYVTGKIPDYQVEFRMQKKDGTYRWILATGRVLSRDAEGNPTRMLGTHMNIDERKKREETFANYTHQLEEANQRMRTFNRLAVGRENKMIELKQEVNALSEELGRKPPYRLDFINDGGTGK